MYGSLNILCILSLGLETDLYQPYGHCRVFQIYWHIECSTIENFQMHKLNLEKEEGTRDQIANICLIIEKTRELKNNLIWIH